MSEMIVKLKKDHVKIKGCEYVRDLIRCEDCKYYEDGLCANIDFLTVKPDDFCSYAEEL